MSIKNPLIGKYVVVRCTAAGVHAGYLQDAKGPECVLTSARRLWGWTAAIGKWLTAVANTGVDPSASKLGPPSVEPLVLTEVCEYIGCSEMGRQSIIDCPND